MGRTRVYIKPFEGSGDYASDWIDVSNYTTKIGSVSVDTDSGDFQVGVYRQSNVTIQLNNREGVFSDIDFTGSIFAFKRADSLVKMTWDLDLEPGLCGMVNCGEFFCSEELDVFIGLLSDESFLENARTEAVDFVVLGLEALFSRIDVPFSILANGDAPSDVIYNILNQSLITDLLTIDALNINPEIDSAIDDISKLENVTVKEALDKLLFASNSVMSIVDQVVYVTSRDQTVDLKQTFYGQASTAGAENIITAEKISNGMHRTFNYLTWEDADNLYDDTASIAQYGVRKIEIGSEFYTDNSKREQILQSFGMEFSFPMQELEIKTPLTYDSLARNLLDKVSIDYPTVIVPTEGFGLPICGIAILGDPTTATLPRGLWSFQVPPDRRFKILKKQIDFKKEIILFKLREVS